MLKLAITNPIVEEYNYFLFETIALIYQNFNIIDAKLYDYFRYEIRQYLIDFENLECDLSGYVMEIFALEMSLLSDNQINNDMMFQNLLQSVLFKDTKWTSNMKYFSNPLVNYIKVSLVKYKFAYSSKPYAEKIFVIIVKLLDLEFFNLAIDLLELILNLFELEFNYDHWMDTVNRLIYIYINLQNNNRRVYVEFSKILVVFLSKFLVKTNSKVLTDLIEPVFPGKVILLLSELSEFITELDLEEKKLTNFALCSYLIDFYNSFDFDNLKLFTRRLIKNLESISKFNLGSRVMVKQLSYHDPSYNAKSYNKIVNAEIKVRKI